MNFKFHYFLILFVFILLFAAGYLLLVKNVLADSGSVNLTVTVSAGAVCGDNVADGSEQCDGTDLNGATCISRGFTGGTLGCNADCTFNTSSCTSAAPAQSSGGGGGGGGGGTAAVSVAPGTAVNFSGRAYPKSTVTLLKDAEVGASTIAGPDSNFSINLSGLSAGSYVFSLYGEDKDGIRSSLFTFSINVTSGVTTSVGGIFIAPTIAVDKSVVRRGENIAIFGQSTAKSEITIEVDSDQSVFAKANSDDNGVYLYNFDTSELDYGSHSTKSKAALTGSVSSFSSVVGFKVSTKNVLAPKPVKKVLKGDFKGDGRVDLTDFSIEAYWYKRPNPPAKFDLDGDGKIDLVDFSIMAYYWTG